jgi:hypothetical protein
MGAIKNRKGCEMSQQRIQRPDNFIMSQYNKHLIGKYKAQDGETYLAIQLMPVDGRTETLFPPAGGAAARPTRSGRVISLPVQSF